MYMNLRKRRAPPYQELAVDIRRQKVEDAASTSSATDVSNAEEEDLTPTIFDNINLDCMKAILDWLPLNSVCVLSQTCKSLRRTTKDYFQEKYPSEEFSAGDEFVFKEQHIQCFGDKVQCLRLYDSSIKDFVFAGSNINRNLREIEFERTYKKENFITHQHIDSIKPILQNAKKISAVDCRFTDGCFEYFLDSCKNLQDLSFLYKNSRKSLFQFQKYPTIRNVAIVFHTKANPIEAIRAIKEQNLHLDELVLTFMKENPLDSVFAELDSMYDMQFFKRLYLAFEKKSMVSVHIDKIASLRGLEGLLCQYTINTSVDNHIEDIVKLQNIRFLNIDWLLENADLIAKELQHLTEVETSVASIDAIVSFVRFSSKLTRFHVEKIRPNKEKRTKFDAFTLNKRRSMLEYARKLTIYIPEEKFIKLKWASVVMDSDLVEIKREESCIPIDKSKENL